MTDSNTEEYKNYSHILEDKGEEEMVKLMKNDINYIGEHFVEIWRLLSALKDKLILTDERLEYLELVLGSSINYPKQVPLSFEELQDNLMKQRDDLLVKEKKNES